MATVLAPSDALQSLLGSGARARILEAIVAAPDQPWAVRELAEAAGADYKSTWTEVARLRDLGLMTRDGSVRAPHHWNRRHPVAAHLESVVNELGAEGVLRLVRQHLAGIPWLESAIVYGSWASRSQRRDSDLDLMLVGTGSDNEVHAKVEELERVLRRPVDHRIYTREEFEKERRSPTSFVSTVLGRPHVVVSGS